MHPPNFSSANDVQEGTRKYSDWSKQPYSKNSFKTRIKMVLKEKRRKKMNYTDYICMVIGLCKTLRKNVKKLTSIEKEVTTPPPKKIELSKRKGIGIYSLFMEEIL